MSFLADEAVSQMSLIDVEVELRLHIEPQFCPRLDLFDGPRQIAVLLVHVRREAPGI
jgi:hypothetical protein